MRRGTAPELFKQCSGSWIDDIVSLNPCFRGELMLPELTRREDMPDHLPMSCQIVTDKSPVTLPVHAFRTQIGAPLLFRDLQQLLNPLLKNGGLHIVGVVMEAGIS